jgi:glycosyltransferase involved in cell wall biosynthesis
VKVLLVSGTLPPRVCGVGDYTAMLSGALSDEGLDVEVLTTSGPVTVEHTGVQMRARVGGWNPLHIREVVQEIRTANPNIVHLQYPTAEYGAGLLPQMLVSLGRPFIVTIHEASIAHVLRKASLYPFLMFADRVVATSRYEGNFMSRMHPRVGKRLSVISVGSNIPSTTPRTRDASIAYFGLIAPNKGVEDFLKLAEMAKAAGEKWKFSVIGLTQPRHLSYAEGLRSASRSLPVEWLSGLPDRDVAQRLARSGAVYLPFPDGASLRRGSLAAALTNGAPVITTRGSATPLDMLDDGDVVAFADSPGAAFEKSREILSDTAPAERLSRGARQYAERFAWPRIARRHVALYEEVLGVRRLR